MSPLTLYLDFESPAAWALFRQLPEVLQGRSHCLHYLPVAHPQRTPSPEGLARLRLAWACCTHGSPNRHVCETLLRQAWEGTTQGPDPVRAPDSAEVDAALQAQCDAARVAGVRELPALHVDGRLFQGADLLPSLQAWLRRPS